VVRLRRPLALEAGGPPAAALPGGPAAAGALLGAGEWVARAAGGGSGGGGGGGAPRLLAAAEPAVSGGGADAGAAAAAEDDPCRALTRLQLQQLLGAAAEEFPEAALDGGGPTNQHGEQPGSEERGGGGGGRAAHARGLAAALGEEQQQQAPQQQEKQQGEETEAEEDEEEEEERWADALAAAHRLRTAYDWAPSPSEETEEEAFAALLPGGAAALEHALAALREEGEGAAPAPPERSLGAAELLQQWEARIAEAVEAAAAAAGPSDARTAQNGGSDGSSDGSSSSGSGSGPGGNSAQPRPPGLLNSAAEGLAEGLGEALRGLAGREPLLEAAAAAAALNSMGGGAAGAAPGAAAPRPRRRLWRRPPGKEWRAVRWDFDDTSGPGVTVVEALVGPPGERRVAGVAVRDERQEARPVKVRGRPGQTRGACPHHPRERLTHPNSPHATLPHPVPRRQAYVRGEFVAAVLDGAVLAPFTGEVLALVHTSWTPGVSHDLWVYRTARPQPRLLARLRRSWLPPSRAWLFPPRDGDHDVGGWLVEWEGAGRGRPRKPGALDPSVLLAIAATRSLDAEGRASRLQRWWRAALERLLGGRGPAA
jgi:hypothetical protein